MKISIGCDHAGVLHKNEIVAYLKAKNIQINDRGTNSTDSVDYPDYAHAVSKDVSCKEADMGILLCGSANGVTITANKHEGVRAALCWKDEIAQLARAHNNANVICLPARYTTINECILFIETFIGTPFEGGRHQNRVNKIEISY